MSGDIKLANFMLCENVQNIPTPNGVKTNFINAFNVIEVPFIPTLYSFYVVASFECNTLPDESTLTIVMYDPGEEKILSTGGMIIPKDPFQPQEEQKQFNFSMDFRNFPIQVCGEYVIDIFVNDENIGRKWFRVVTVPRS